METSGAGVMGRRGRLAAAGGPDADRLSGLERATRGQVANTRSRVIVSRRRKKTALAPHGPSTRDCPRRHSSAELCFALSTSARATSARGSRLRTESWLRPICSATWARDSRAMRDSEITSR